MLKTTSERHSVFTNRVNPLGQQPNGGAGVGGKSLGWEGGREGGRGGSGGGRGDKGGSVEDNVRASLGLHEPRQPSGTTARRRGFYIGARGVGGKSLGWEGWREGRGRGGGGGEYAFVNDVNPPGQQPDGRASTLAPGVRETR